MTYTFVFISSIVPSHSLVVQLNQSRRFRAAGITFSESFSGIRTRGSCKSCERFRLWSRWLIPPCWRRQRLRQDCVELAPETSKVENQYARTGDEVRPHGHDPFDVKVAAVGLRLTTETGTTQIYKI